MEWVLFLLESRSFWNQFLIFVSKVESTQVLIEFWGFLISRTTDSSNNHACSGTPLQYSCLENPMDGGAWWAAVHGVAKSRTWLSDFTCTFHFHALEKEMATHSGVLAWRIPGTGEPGGLPSMGSHRVGHDWSNLAAAAAAAVVKNNMSKMSSCLLLIFPSHSFVIFPC